MLSSLLLPQRKWPLSPPYITIDPSCFRVFEQPETQHNFLFWVSVELLLQSLQQGPCSPEFCDHNLWGSYSPSDQRTAQDHFHSSMWLGGPGQMETQFRSCLGGHPKADQLYRDHSPENYLRSPSVPAFLCPWRDPRRCLTTPVLPPMNFRFGIDSIPTPFSAGRWQ